MPKRDDIKSILIVGAGPIVIGQALSLIHITEHTRRRGIGESGGRL